jgi:TfoX/Sxy family transcriptional regulator of competence genes
VAYDEQLAQRVREVLAPHPEVAERKMFGGLAFMLRGNMCCGIVDDELMVRVGPEGHADAIDQPHAREMDFTGKPSKGMVYVARAGVTTKKALASWVDKGVEYALTLPAK